MTPLDILTGCLDYAKKSILSVGSGDGSQIVSIVEQGSINILATFYDSREQVIWKYPPAKDNLQLLEKKCRSAPRFEIDGTKLEAYGLGNFDLIIFTFPHTGVPNSDPRSTESNRQLLRDFLVSAQKLLNSGGEIQITLKRGQVYDDWKLHEIMDHDPSIQLKYKSKHPFDRSQFPGYKHRLTNGMRGSLKEVPEKQGAIVHVFESSATTEATDSTNSVTTFSGKLVTMVEQCESPWSDAEVWGEILALFEASPKGGTVLQLRQLLPKPPPETRQMNRVLYSMEHSGLLDRRPPDSKGPNQKPQWKLSRKRKTIQE